MADDTLEDLVRRLTALVIKIEERDTYMIAMLDELREFTREQREFNREQREFNREQREFNREQREFNREQREFNREQVRINARLETLMTEVFRERHNGRDA